jgi:hypothetical protein
MWFSDFLFSLRLPPFEISFHARPTSIPSFIIEYAFVEWYDINGIFIGNFLNLFQPLRIKEFVGGAIGGIWL